MKRDGGGKDSREEMSASKKYKSLAERIAALTNPQLKPGGSLSIIIIMIQKRDQMYSLTLTLILF